VYQIKQQRRALRAWLLILPTNTEESIRLLRSLPLRNSLTARHALTAQRKNKSNAFCPALSMCLRRAIWRRCWRLVTISIEMRVDYVGLIPIFLSRSIFISPGCPRSTSLVVCACLVPPCVQGALTLVHIKTKACASRLRGVGGVMRRDVAEMAVTLHLIVPWVANADGCVRCAIAITDTLVWAEATEVCIRPARQGFVAARVLRALVILDRTSSVITHSLVYEDGFYLSTILRRYCTIHRSFADLACVFVV